MTGCFEILVLVANEKAAALYSNNDGASRLLRRIERVLPRNETGDDFNPGAIPSHMFACELMMVLGHCAYKQDCDGVMIFAEGSMMEDLRRVTTHTVAKLMLAQIVGKIIEPFRLPDAGAANAQLALCGGLK